MSHTNCYCKKHKHFGLSHVRLGGRPLVKSVKVVMVVPVSLCHQRCYNLRKKQLENSEWTGGDVYTWGFTVSYPLRAPCKGVNYTCLRARGRSTADLIQSEYDQKHLSLLNCWTLDHWMSGSPVAGVTPLACLANLPHPQMCSRLRPLCPLHFCCPTPVWKSGWGTRTCVSWEYSWLLTLSKWQAMIRECSQLTCLFFLRLRLSWPQGHSAIGRIMSNKISKDTIWNQTSDLPICSAAP